MLALYIILGIFAVLLIGVLVTAFICFRLTFYSKPRDPEQLAEYRIPPGEAYLPFRDEMAALGVQVVSVTQPMVGKDLRDPTNFLTEGSSWTRLVLLSHCCPVSGEAPPSTLTHRADSSGLSDFLLW